MLLIGHEHVMKIPEFHMNCLLIILMVLILYMVLFSTKQFKAHLLAYTVFP